MRIFAMAVMLLLCLLHPALAKGLHTTRHPYCCGMKGDSPACAQYGAYVRQNIISIAQASGLSQGVSQCSFEINSRGIVVQNVCSGSSNAHNEYLRRALSGLRFAAPPLPRSFYSQKVSFY